MHQTTLEKSVCVCMCVRTCAHLWMCLWAIMNSWRSDPKMLPGSGCRLLLKLITLSLYPESFKA